MSQSLAISKPFSQWQHYSIALPQVMAYMMANPHPDRPVSGLVINGDEFMFVKMLMQGIPQYDLSNVFSLLIPRRNQLL